MEESSSNEIQVSKRFFVTVPDIIGDALDRWAQAERNKPATLAAFLLEQVVRQAIDEGKVPAPTKSDELALETVQQLILQGLAASNRKWSQVSNPITVFAEEAQLEVQEIQGILAGERPSPEQCLALARVLEFDEIQLLALVKDQYKGQAKSK